MTKLKRGDRVVIEHEGRSVAGTVRSVGCNDPECPSCEQHWRDELEETPPERRPN